MCAKPCAVAHRWAALSGWNLGGTLPFLPPRVQAGADGLRWLPQVPDLTLWYGPDTYMGANLEELFTSLAALPDEEVKQLHRGTPLPSPLPRTLVDAWPHQLDISACDSWFSFLLPLNLGSPCVSASMTAPPDSPSGLSPCL